MGEPPTSVKFSRVDIYDLPVRFFISYPLPAGDAEPPILGEPPRDVRPIAHLPRHAAGLALVTPRAARTQLWQRACGVRPLAGVHKGAKVRGVGGEGAAVLNGLVFSTASFRGHNRLGPGQQRGFCHLLANAPLVRVAS